MVNIIVEVSKYLMIVLMSIYTYTCFSIFGYYDPEDKRLKLREQNILMFLIHAVGYVPGN